MGADASAERQYAVTLPLHAAAASQARHEIRHQLASWQLADHLDTVELVVTELVTNAIQHGQPRETLPLEVTADDKRIRITVVDGSALRPVARQVEADETSGRGMHIVEELVDRWGTDDDHEGGKLVWVEVNVALAD